MDDDRARFILEIPSLDERRVGIIKRALDLAVTTKSLVGNDADGYALRKRYAWAKGELDVAVEFSHTDGGNDHLELKIHELGMLVFHVTAIQRLNQRRRVMQAAFVHRDIESYWEAVIRYAKP